MTVTEDEIYNRINRLQAKLKAEAVDLAVIISNANLYYLSGTIQGDYLFVPSTGEPILAVRNSQQRAKTETVLNKVVSFTRSSELPEILSGQEIDNYYNFGVEQDVVSYRQVLNLQNLLAVNREDICGITRMLRELRMIKSKAELAAVRQAADQLKIIPQVVADNLTAGMTELELSAIIEAELRKRGHSGIVRMRGLNNEPPIGICTAGDNGMYSLKSDALCGGRGTTAAFGIGAADDKINPGQPIVLDFVSNYQGYHADQTRLAVLGGPDSYFNELYNKMKEFLNQLSYYLTPECTWEEVYNQGQKLAAELEVTDYYLGIESNNVQFVGHGVGLELNEFPFLASSLNYNLQAGMVIALEPKLLVPNLGMVGIENSYLVTESEPEKLTTCSEELIVVN